MLSDNFQFNNSNDSLEDASFKSCFARSVVVNSKHSKNNVNDHQSPGSKNSELNNKDNVIVTSTPILPKRKKDLSIADYVFSNNSNEMSYGSASSRIAEVPVENVFSKSQIETLEWQLKQTEASREMYRAVMLQVVKFLERAHRSLKLLGSKLNGNCQTMPRTKQELGLSRINECETADSTFSSMDTLLENDEKSDTWKRSRKMPPLLEEMLPEKLSQEAFMLLRTAESLLNTKAPDLTYTNADKDLKFLTQLAKEFPCVDDQLSQEGDYSNISILSLEPSSVGIKPSRIKQSMSLNKTQMKMRNNKTLSNSNNSKTKINGNYNYDVVDSHARTDSFCSLKSSNELNNIKLDTFQVKSYKTEVLPISSASSAEDESGFSSITSFQDLGIPLTYSINTEEKNKPKESSLSKSKDGEIKSEQPNPNEIKLWNTTTPNDKLEKLYNSNTIGKLNVTEEKPLQVLWV